MFIELTHPFIFRCFDVNCLLDNCQNLLNDCHKLNTFLNKVEAQSKDPRCQDGDKYKGDALELFAEALIKFSPIDGRIGITDYKPVIENDTGVDGVGIGNNGNPATVQVKHRIANWILTADTDHLSNFPNASFMKYGVKPEDDKNMLIITTAKELHHYTTTEMFGNKVRCLNRENLKHLVDDNKMFWKLFRDEWIAAIERNKKS